MTGLPFFELFLRRKEDGGGYQGGEVRGRDWEERRKGNCDWDEKE